MSIWSRRDFVKGTVAASVATTALLRRVVRGEVRSATSSPATQPARDLVLWYRQPASVWTEALPVGAGRIGAMIFGGVPREQIQFNEDTVWTGGPHEYQHEGAVKFLPQIRQLIADGKQPEAEELAMREFMSVPIRQRAYQPFGDLRLEFPGDENVDDYHRELDLDSALARVSYRVGDVSFTREVFASYPHQVLVVRLTA